MRTLLENGSSFIPKLYRVEWKPLKKGFSVNPITETGTFLQMPSGLVWQLVCMLRIVSDSQFGFFPFLPIDDSWANSLWTLVSHRINAACHVRPSMVSCCSFSFSRKILNHSPWPHNPSTVWIIGRFALSISGILLIALYLLHQCF